MPLCVCAVVCVQGCECHAFCQTRVCVAPYQHEARRAKVGAVHQGQTDACPRVRDLDRTNCDNYRTKCRLRSETETETEAEAQQRVEPIKTSAINK